MQCCHQCKLKSKASLSFADLVSFVFSLFSTSLLKPAVCRGLGKRRTVYKFADLMLEKYGFINLETKRSTEFQAGQRSCDPRIAPWWPKGAFWLVQLWHTELTLRKTWLWSRHFLVSIMVPCPEAFVYLMSVFSLCLWYARLYSSGSSYAFHWTRTKPFWGWCYRFLYFAHE